MNELLDWIRSHDTMLWLLGVGSLVTFFGSLVAIPFLVSRMPADYFLNDEPPPGSWRRAHPALRMTLIVLKNVAGALFVLAGIAMLVLPGQGILTIVIGISCLDFPGKRRLERRLVSIRALLRSINWMRARAGRPPLEVARKTAAG